MELVKDFWSRFLKVMGKRSDEPCPEAWHFGLHSEAYREMANALLDLTLKGTKKATSSLLMAYEADAEPIPQKGDLSILTDWEGTPFCVLETTNVLFLPYYKMSYEICSKEGEDNSLEEWKMHHRKAFRDEAAVKGFHFNDDMIVVFEEFMIVYREDKYPANQGER